MVLSDKLEIFTGWTAIVLGSIIMIAAISSLVNIYR